MNIYLNTAGTGMVNPSGLQAAQDFLKRSKENPEKPFMDWMATDLPKLRKDAALLLGTEMEQVSFMPNFSFALSTIIQSLEGKIKKVLLYKNDYPSVNLPFELGDFEVSYLKSADGFHLDVNDLEQRLEKEHIDVLALSHVQYLTGFKADILKIGALCRSKKVLFILDGTQSAGTTSLHFNELPVDVLISSSYKWLNGGLGSALLLVKPSFMERFTPRIAGYGSMNRSGVIPTYQPSNRSFEPGHLSPLSLLQLQGGITHKLEAGVSSLERHNKQLIRQLQEGLSETPFPIIGEDDNENRLSILCIRAPKEVGDYLRSNGLIITWRQNSIRISPHYYNTETEIEYFIQALKDYKD